jgi:hypothetical protein
LVTPTSIACRQPRFGGHLPLVRDPCNVK